jgi:hypothetical protein
LGTDAEPTGADNRNVNVEQHDGMAARRPRVSDRFAPSALHRELATNMNRSCKRASDLVQPSLLTLRYQQTNHAMERAMIEFFRSGLIILMGMTVMAAGVLVVFYG